LSLLRFCDERSCPDLGSGSYCVFFSVAILSSIMSITVPDTYGLVLLLASLTYVNCWMQGLAVNGKRKKFFNADFFKTFFPEMKEKPPVRGYPDM
jgi:hypothetical protein